MNRFALALIVLAGCTFAVDPVLVTPDAAVPDLASVVEVDGAVGDLSLPDLEIASPDLAAQPDLKVAPDLLLKPDLLCAPPLFTGFPGAADPFDCRPCGCVIDDFTSLSANRWTTNAPAEWTVALAAGVATFSTPNAGSGDNAQLTSDGHFYLKGDFDVLVDFQIDTFTGGGGSNLASFGPGLSGFGSSPTVFSHIFYSGGPTYYLDVDGNSPTFAATSDQGTFEILRTGSTICAQIAGGPMNCRSASETKNVTVALDTNLNNGTCATNCMAGGGCCVQKSEFHNLRLKSGVIVSTP